MRIAFTSCFSAELYPEQPVWQEIAGHDPDVLVLLGDAIYLDCSYDYDTASVQAASEYEFARHAQGLYRQQLNQPEFRQLVRRETLRSYAIWDDHDFLWNDACGADVMDNPALRPLVYPSRALFASWRKALRDHLAPGSFPADLPGWSNVPAPGYQHVNVGGGVHLHLTDGRSWRRRGGAALLGRAQLDALEAAMVEAGPGATHLLASSSVVEARNGECWMKCGAEYARLMDLASRHNILVLSGDIHDNRLASYVNAGRSLFEATASGAALKTGVVIGSMQRNWGLLDVDAQQVGITLFKSGTPQYRATLDRRAWQ